MSNDNIIALAQSLLKDDRLVPFVGAGLSARFGLLSWTGLIDEIAQMLGWDPDVYRLHGDNLQLAAYYVLKEGTIGPLRSTLDRMFNPTNEQIRGSRSHTALVNLNPSVIYTTNYDQIIERSFQLAGKPYHVIARIDDICTASGDVAQIVKFHGTFDNDESLVLTEESYFERLAFENPLDIKLRAENLGKTLLFIGYSFNDLNIRYMIYKLHRIREQAAASVDLPVGIMLSYSDSEIQHRLLERWNVHTAVLDPSQRDESLDEFLEALI